MKEYDELAITEPFQAKLFGVTHEDDTIDSSSKKLRKVGANYSQSLAVIDQMPRFFLGQQHNLRKKYNGLLPALVRDYVFQDTPYRIEVTPAILVNDQNESVAHYPGKAENVLDIVLRKFYLANNPQLLDGKCGMSFSINSLMEELAKYGHARSYYEVIDSLKILKGSQITCLNKLNNEEVIFNILDSLKLKKKKNDDSMCYLTFSDVVTVAINHLVYRRYNYSQVIGYKHFIARQLQILISHNFTSVDEDNFYPINVTTMISAFGLSYRNMYETISEVRKALKQMEEAYVIKEYDEQPIYDKKNKRTIVDYSIKIKFTKNFIFEMIRSNQIKKAVKNLKKAAQAEDLKTESKVDATLFPLYSLKEAGFSNN